MAGDNTMQFTKDNFDQEVLKADKPVLVDFWAPWCGPCRLVGPVIDELAGEYNGKVKVGKINVDEQGELASKFRVMSIPTIMLFKNGEMVERIVGARSKDEFAKLLDNNM